MILFPKLKFTLSSLVWPSIFAMAFGVSYLVGASTTKSIILGLGIVVVLPFLKIVIKIWRYKRFLSHIGSLYYPTDEEHEDIVVAVVPFGRSSVACMSQAYEKGIIVGRAGTYRIITWKEIKNVRKLSCYGHNVAELALTKSEDILFIPYLPSVQEFCNPLNKGKRSTNTILH